MSVLVFAHGPNPGGRPGRGPEHLYSADVLNWPARRLVADAPRPVRLRWRRCRRHHQRRGRAGGPRRHVVAEESGDTAIRPTSRPREQRGRRLRRPPVHTPGRLDRRGARRDREVLRDGGPRGWAKIPATGRGRPTALAETVR